ncbi:unnamed protein product [Ectocarpus sp. 12 AP-2014]
METLDRQRFSIELVATESLPFGCSGHCGTTCFELYPLSQNGMQRVVCSGLSPRNDAAHIPWTALPRQDLNEHRLPGARHVGNDEMDQIKQDALGVGARTDLNARQALTRKHSEMARRASETAFYEDDGARSTSTPERGGDGSSVEGGSAVVEDAEAGIAPRKSFVMKRVWGGMKMVEVDEHGHPVAKAQLGAIMEERERASSTVSNSARPDQDGGSKSAGTGTGGLATLRGRLGSASNIISARVRRSSSASTWEGDEKEAESVEDGKYNERPPMD